MILLMNVDNENPSEIEGTNTQIEGAGILDFELKGNTHQDSYTGKNLLNLSSEYSVTGYKKINVNLGAGTYTISLKSVNLGGNTNAFIRFKNGENELAYFNVATTQLSKTITVNNTINSIYIYSQDSYVHSQDVTSTFNKLMIEAGSTATEYEPFVGGSPSPSPDYPQDIHIVSGDNTINICGKNLFNGAFELGGIEINNGNNDSASDRVRTKEYIPVQPNTEYTISGVKASRFAIFYDSNKGYLGYSLVDSQATSGTITTLTNTAYIRWYVIQTNTNVNEQLELGTTATTYAPYQSQSYAVNLGDIELCKIGTYQDYIYKDSGKWYKHSEIGKVVLDGSEADWRASTTNENYSSFFIIKDDMMINKSVFSNYFSQVAISTLTNASGVGIAPHNTLARLYFGIETSTASTRSAFTIWLGTHNTIVYYVLATPTNTEITDTDLIEQLEAISNSALFDGVNYIDLNSDNLIGSYKITYSNWYRFEKILRSGYNINEDNDRITQKFANGHRKQFVSDYKDCIITLNLDTIDIDTTKEYLRQLKSGPYKYYSLENKEYKTAQFIIEKRPELKVNNSIGDNTDIDEYQVTLLRAGD